MKKLVIDRRLLVNFFRFSRSELPIKILSPNYQSKLLFSNFFSSNQQDTKHDQSASRRLPIAAAIAASLIYKRNSDDNDPPFVNNPKLRNLFHAILKGNEREVKRIVKEMKVEEINGRHDFGWQPLHTAAVNGFANICKILLENGADIDSPDYYRTPVEMSMRTNTDISFVILARESEFNSMLEHRANFYGSTPLHYAALADSAETVEVLLRHGANPNVANLLGHKPHSYANSKISKILISYQKNYEDRLKQIEFEERKRFPLEKRIKEHIIGQEAAISIVAATIRRKENGWFDENHPLVFLFLGSSGIGKTELAKQVANYIHKGKKNGFIRLDMSEYQEKHSVARMIGSPPGYVGHNDGGQLTDALKKCKNAVVLFDEVEKAHPDVLTVLLQLFDEGRLTDGKGQTIECKDAIFIMTSNLASEEIARHAIKLREEQRKLKERQLVEIGKSKLQKPDKVEEQVTISTQFKETIVRRVLKNHFKRDEFLGRINEMVYFLPFTDSELRALVQKELNFWKRRAKEKNSIDLIWDDEVVNVICKGYNIHYGARSIKYEVERRIVNLISELQNSSPHMKRAHVSVSSDEKGNDLISIKVD